MARKVGKTSRPGPGAGLTILDATLVTKNGGFREKMIWAVGVSWGLLLNYGFQELFNRGKTMALLMLFASFFWWREY